MSRRRLARIVIAACAVLPLLSCSTVLEGNPVSVFADPFSVAGMPATDGPSGLRPDAEPGSREVTGTDNGDIDKLAGAAVSDIEEFWHTAYADSFDSAFQPVSELISWDAHGYDGEFCGEDTYGLVNAAFCKLDRSIGWDRGVLMPSLRKDGGDMAAVLVLAHEYGHSVQQQAKLITRGTPTLVSEQQADCLAGTYMRWVAEGSSPRFTLNTGDGLNNVLAAVIAFRDPLQSEDDAQAGADQHGSAFERVSAFQFGFTDGPSACAAIDVKEITERRGDLPVLLTEDQTGELPITDKSVRAMVDALNTIFTPAEPPQLSFDVAQTCPNARPSAPASYCPATNTIVVDLKDLAAMGVKNSEDDDGAALADGDNTAFSVLTSRYMLSLQNARGVALNNAEAALRTACLTGVANAKLSKNMTLGNGDSLVLTAGDIDEAVSGILTNGLVASDVNGESVPSGFSRIDAFRLGVLGDTERCFKRFA
ncbi:neutral zinc metallopeptidase [Mycobacterium sp. 141]|uniref:neutral zinc metallopeptidase n=1 Tax=Mycobacterium sp. 141 TaxID=1120797 RepID=UPI0004769FF2|nr:neutral zinc metallopeptidase [Mycobacterium sp. 141]